MKDKLERGGYKKRQHAEIKNKVKEWLSNNNVHNISLMARELNIVYSTAFNHYQIWKKEQE